MKNRGNSIMMKVLLVATIGEIIVVFLPQLFLLLFDPHYLAWANGAICETSMDLRCVFPFTLTVTTLDYIIFFTTAAFIYTLVAKKHKNIALKYIVISVLLIMLLGRLSTVLITNNFFLSRLIAIGISPFVYGVSLKFFLKNKRLL